jgi:hypothetical protein
MVRDVGIESQQHENTITAREYDDREKMAIALLEKLND